MASFGKALDKGLDILEVLADEDQPLSFTALREKIDVSPASFARFLKQLVERGYAEEDIRKILGGNFMRVFRQVCD